MSENTSPFVTVIMPVRNEVAHIESSLQSVLRQQYPADRMEVLVADGRSDDGTPERIREIAAGPTGPTIHVLDNPGRIVPTGFNIALQKAKGDIIVRVDGHCTLASDYVEQCVATLQETGADNVGGCQTPVGRSLVGEAVAAATTSAFGVGNAKFHYANEPGWVDTVYLGAWPRSVFEKIGGFDEDLVRNQDDEFNFRLLQNGGRIWLNPAIRSTYYCRGSLRRLSKQYYQYGLYKVLVAKKRGGVSSWRHLVPASFVIALALTVGLAAATGSWAWLLPVAVPYATANLVAGIRSANKNWRIVPAVCLVFVILHVSYGIGFLVGLWRWRTNPRREHAIK